MKFFIVTPTFNSLRWLPGCIASVRAQVAAEALNVKTVKTPDGSLNENPVLTCDDLNDLNDFDEAGGRLNATVPVAVHHHIQDGGSTDGTVEWLRQYDAEVRGQRTEDRGQRAEDRDQSPLRSSCAGQVAEGYAEPREDRSQQLLATRHSSLATPAYTFSYSSERDAGMYDALNKGWERADESVDWLGHLNSDEQYQPGVLARIAQAGRANPSWGAITGNCVWVNEQGGYLCSRKPSIGWPWVGRIWIPAATCALFIRRKFYGKDRARFDISWKSFGDKVFCRDLLNAGCKFGYLDDYMALFIHRGSENLGFQPVTEVERTRYWNEELGSMERRFAPVSIFAAKASRVLRNRFGQKCRNYVWIDPCGMPLNIAVENHRWTI